MNSDWSDIENLPLVMCITCHKVAYYVAVPTWRVASSKEVDEQALFIPGYCDIDDPEGDNDVDWDFLEDGSEND